MCDRTAPVSRGCADGTCEGLCGKDGIAALRIMLVVENLHERELEDSRSHGQLGVTASDARVANEHAAERAWVQLKAEDQAEFIGTNLSALVTGTLFAYFMEKLKRECELMHRAALKSARETQAADSMLNHVLKN